MIRRKGHYRPIQPEAVSTTESALANLRTQLESALGAAEYFKGTDDITARRHAEHAGRLKAEIAELEDQAMIADPPSLDLAALKSDFEAELAKPALVATRAVRDARIMLALIARVEVAETAVFLLNASESRLNARAEAAEAKVEAVRELHWPASRLSCSCGLLLRECSVIAALGGGV